MQTRRLGNSDLDITAIGQNLSPEQWYGGLLRRLGMQLDPSGDLEEALDDFWFGHDRMGPLDRWMEAMQRLILPSCNPIHSAKSP